MYERLDGGEFGDVYLAKVSLNESEYFVAVKKIKGKRENISYILYTYSASKTISL